MRRGIGLFFADDEKNPRRNCRNCLQVEACPLDNQTDGWTDLRNFFGALMGGMKRFDSAVHEWLGLFVYWVTGPTPVLVQRNNYRCTKLPI